jgi:hypothetical protein
MMEELMAMTNETPIFFWGKGYLAGGVGEES